MWARGLTRSIDSSRVAKAASVHAQSDVLLPRCIAWRLCAIISKGAERFKTRTGEETFLYCPRIQMSGASNTPSRVRTTSSGMELSRQVSSSKTSMILVMGVTGSGKSHFINTLARGRGTMRESASLRSGEFVLGDIHTTPSKSTNRVVQKLRRAKY